MKHFSYLAAFITLLILSTLSSANSETIEQRILVLEQQNKMLRETKQKNEQQLGRLIAQQQKEFKDSEEFLAQLHATFRDIHKQASLLPVTQLHPGRLKTFSELGHLPFLPSPEQLEHAVHQLQTLIEDTSIRATIDTPVVQPDGSQIIQPVTYAGPFAAISEGNFLIYQPELDKLLTAPYQPNIIARLHADDFVENDHLTLPIDPGHGALLTALSRQPSLWSKIESSGLSGWLILFLGASGIAITWARLSALQKERYGIKWQRVHMDTLSDNNSLGRTLISLNNAKHSGYTGLLFAGQILKNEKLRLYSGLSTIRLFILLNPLIGLFATSTGVMKTLQTILSGTGQEPAFAAGAAQAMMPLVLGLATTIPLLLCYFHLKSRCLRLEIALEKQVTRSHIKTREEYSSYHYKNEQPVILSE